MISVIVPVYNVEKYVGRCLDSLINQTNKKTGEMSTAASCLNCCSSPEGNRTPI